MYFTLNQAAKETGKSKGTISRYLKSGKLSYVQKTEGGYEIDPSELFRVFPRTENKTAETGTIEQSETPTKQGKTPLLEIENTFLRDKIHMLEEQLRKAELREQDLSAKLDKAQSTIERQTYLITDLREKPPQTHSQGKRRFLGIFPLSNN